MTLYALQAADGRLLWGPADWQPRAVARAVQGLGLNASFGAAAPAAAVQVYDTATPRQDPEPDEEGGEAEPGPEPDPVEVARIVPVADRPDHDPELQTCGYDWDAGEWVLGWRPADTIRAVLVERSRQKCRAGILAAAPEDDQRNAALAGGQTAADMLATIQSWRGVHAAHKAALDDLSTSADLAAYDVAADWPDSEA